MRGENIHLLREPSEEVSSSEEVQDEVELPFRLKRCREHRSWTPTSDKSLPDWPSSRILELSHRQTHHNAAWQWRDGWPPPGCPSPSSFWPGPELEKHRNHTKNKTFPFFILSFLLPEVLSVLPSIPWILFAKSFEASFAFSLISILFYLPSVFFQFSSPFPPSFTSFLFQSYKFRLVRL